MKDINTSQEGVFSLSPEYADAAGQTVWSECSGDFTLPEYMPEISKMIKADGRVIPTGKYIGAERAEFSGSVVYSILYAGEDGLPYFTTLECEYEYAVPLGEALGCGEIEIYDESSIESTTVRPSGPRKLSVKSKIKGVPHVVYRKEADAERLSSLSAPEYQRLSKTERVINVSHFECGEFELEEALRIDGASPECEIIGCEGNVYINEVRASSDGILCRGECECSIYYYDIQAGRRSFSCSKKKMRFEKDIPAYHPFDVQNVRAYGKVISADISAQDDTGELLMSLTLNIWGEYTCEQEKEYVTDLYSCGCECDLEYKNEQLKRGVLCKNANFSCHGQKKLEGECTADVCSSVATARVESVSVDGDTANVSGEISVDVLLCKTEDGTLDYTTENIAVPFKCALDVLCTAQKYDSRIAADVAGVRVRCEKDSIFADAELYLSAFIEGTDSIRAVKSAETLEDIKDTEGDCVRIYYPDKNESLWSVGKKYGRRIDSLSRINSLDVREPDSAESLLGVRSLVIK